MERRTGRPPVYSAEDRERIARIVFRRLVGGVPREREDGTRDPDDLTGEPVGVARILSTPAFPGELCSPAEFWRWLVEDPQLEAAYTKARELQAEAIFDQVVEISDDRDDEAASRRVRVDARKWALGRMCPKRYGARIALTGPDGGPLELQHGADLDALEAVFARFASRGASSGDAP